MSKRLSLSLSKRSFERLFASSEVLPLYEFAFPNIYLSIRVYLNSFILSSPSVSSPPACTVPCCSYFARSSFGPESSSSVRSRRLRWSSVCSAFCRSTSEFSSITRARQIRKCIHQPLFGKDLLVRSRFAGDRVPGFSQNPEERRVIKTKFVFGEFICERQDGNGRTTSRSSSGSSGRTYSRTGSRTGSRTYSRTVRSVARAEETAAEECGKHH